MNANSWLTTFWIIIVSVISIGDDVNADILHKLMGDEELANVLRTLNITNPLVVSDQIHKSRMTSFSKTLFKLNQSVVIVTPAQINNYHHPDLWLSEDKLTLIRQLSAVPRDSQDMRLGSRKPLLVVCSNTGHLLSSLNLTIDQQVYFLDIATWNLSETYVINHQRMDQVLGYFAAANGFQWIKNSKLHGNVFDIVDRRPSFHGIKLMAMTDSQPPYNIFKSGYRQTARNVTEIPNTFEVTYLVQGLFHEVLLLCEEELNFTTTIYKRFDGQWGSYNSATGQWTGIVHSIIKQEIDISIASLGITIERANAIQFLPPLAEESYSLAIKNPDAEDLSWVTYLDQFSQDLWLAMFSVSIIVALVMWITDEASNHRRDPPMLSIARFFSTLWLAFSANFGNKPAKPPGKNNLTGKILVFSCLMGGTIMFMSYRGSMMAILAARRVKMPFATRDELLNTDYKVITRYGGMTADQFHKAEPGSVMAKIKKQRMTADSFIPEIEVAFETLANKHHIAYFWTKESIYSRMVQTNEKCKYVFPWVSQFPYAMSFGLPKNSPYFKFLKRTINKIKENGALSSIHSRWMHPVEKCPATPARAISIEKIFTLFFIISGGLIMALTLFILEIMYDKITRRDSDVPQSGTPVKDTNALLDELTADIHEAMEIVRYSEVPVQDLHADKREVLMFLDDMLDFIGRIDRTKVAGK